MPPQITCASALPGKTGNTFSLKCCVVESTAAVVLCCTHSASVCCLPERTRRPASADRTARRQFQATGQLVSRMQASNAVTSRLPRYEAKCVQRRCFQCGSVTFRSDIYKTRHNLLSNNANCTMLRAVVLTKYRRVTDRRTAGRTDGQTDGRNCRS